MEADKILQRVSFAVQQPNYSLPVMREVKTSGGYQTYGEDNLYPQSLINMYSQSAVHRAIILRKRDEIVANGLYSAIEGLSAFLYKCNRKGDSFEDIFSKIVTDYIIFGGFSLQIIFGKASKRIEEIYYIDISKLRYNLDSNKVKYAKDWSMQRVKTIEYDLYHEGVTSGSSIFYYGGSVTREWYPVPEYIGSLAAIQSDIEISNTNLSQIKNGMFPSLMVNLKNGIPSPEEQQAIERDFLRKFGGSSAAGKIMFNFSENADSPNVEIKPIDQPDLANRLILLQDQVRDSIFVGHRVTNSALFGVQQAGKLGGQSAEYAEGYEIWQKTYVIPQQKVILRILNRLLSVNFSGCDLKINPLEPIGNFFTDQVLIASMMAQSEVRAKLKESGWVENITVPEGEKLMVNDNVVNPVDITDKQFLQPEDDNTSKTNP